MNQINRFINLTPHTINVLNAAGARAFDILPSGEVARCAVYREPVKILNGIPVNKTVFGEVENLPDPEPNTYYIVSALVANAIEGREDVLIPDDTVRDSEGRIIGCRSFARK